MTSHFNDDGAALPVWPPLARKPPVVEMPQNQFEPWVDVAAAYRRRMGIMDELDIQELMLAAADCGLVLCPERRAKPR